MSEYCCVFIHVFSGRQTVVSFEGINLKEVISPSTLGVRLACFLRALSDIQVERMIRRLHEMHWVDEYATVPEHIQDRYRAFGYYDSSACWWRDRHDQPSKHTWSCISPAFHATHSLPQILDGALTHMIDDTALYDEGELEYRWEYRIDWDRRRLHIAGPGPDEMRVAFNKVDAEWLESCQKANEACESGGPHGRPSTYVDDVRREVDAFVKERGF